jgi:hypothetical protein
MLLTIIYCVNYQDAGLELDKSCSAGSIGSKIPQKIRNVPYKAYLYLLIFFSVKLESPITQQP